MKHDPDRHHRTSTRLKAFDYSSDGAYFVTVCANGRFKIFGNVVNGQMRLNDAGNMIQQKWLEVPRSFPSLFLDAFVVMPDHVHLIVGLDAQEGDHGDRPTDATIPRDANGHVHPTGTAPDSLGRIIQLFKTVTTQAYIRGVHEQSWMPFEKRLWQRNYWDRVIRNERELEEKRTYILENPQRWSARAVA